MPSRINYTVLLVMLITLNCLMGLNSIAQEQVSLFYNSKWEIVTPSGTFEYHRKCSLTADGEFDGEIIDFDKDGKKNMIGNYARQSKEGIFTYYHSNGNVQATGNYKNNEISGEWSYFTEDNKLFIKVDYKSPHTMKVYRASGEEVDSIDLHDNTSFAMEVNKLTSIDLRHKITESFVREKSVNKNHYPALTTVFDRGGEAEMTENNKTVTEKFDTVDEMPKYPGGNTAFYQFIASQIEYPKSARRNYIQGVVYVSFVIDESGFLQDIHTLRGIGSGCDEEAERVIGLSPKWEPAKKDGRTVRVKMLLPITFKLPKKK